MKKIIFILLSVMTMTYSSFAQQEGAKVDFKSMDLPSAMKLAEESGKMVFCNFSTSWCGPCKTQFKEVYSDERVGRLMNENFISLYIDAEAEEWKEIARRYKISGYPTMLILDSKGEVQLTLTGAKKRGAFIEDINRFLNPERSPEGLRKRYDAGERTPELISDYALLVLRNGEEEEGKRIVNDYYNSLSDLQKVSKENWFLFEQFMMSNDDDKKYYLINNYSSFKENIDNEKLDKHVVRCFKTDIFPYISGYLIANDEFSQEKMDKTKQMLEEIKLDDKKELYALYNIAEARVNGDLGRDKGYSKFMKVVSEEAENLSKGTYGTVLMNLSFLSVPGSDSAKKTGQKLLDNYRAKFESEIPSMELIFLKRLESSFIIFRRGKSIDFEKDTPIADLMKRSSESGKLIFIDCYTTWCGPCKMLDEQTFNVKEAKKYFEKNFINVKIDMEKGEGPELAKRFKIKGYPTMLLVDADGNVIHSESKFMTADKLLEIYKKANEAVLKK